MRQEMIFPSLGRRVANRANLSILLLVGGMFCLFRVTAGPKPVGAPEIAFPFLLLLAHLAFAPLPWQWTGDEAPMTGLGRGFIQALVFNLGWVLLLLIILHALEPDAVPPPPMDGAPGGPFPGPLSAHGPVGAPEGSLQEARRLFHRPELMLAVANVAFAIVFGWVFAEKEATEARERRMAGLLRHSRSRALQNQLDPHVLYNALNGLSELVHEDPAAAEEMIARLADLYRMLTHHGEAESVPLRRERLLVEAYLAMEELRLGDRLKVLWTWPPWADPVPVPPLLLQPLVENAVKHGISPSEEGGTLRIACAREGNRLSLSVANTGRSLPSQARDGVGLGNLKARLGLWPEGDDFTLGQVEGWTVATVHWIPRSP